MAVKYLPAQKIATCDRCHQEVLVDTDQDACWRPEWTPEYYKIGLAGADGSKDLCPSCYRKLKEFLKNEPVVQKEVKHVCDSTCSYIKNCANFPVGWEDELKTEQIKVKKLKKKLKKEKGRII